VTLPVGVFVSSPLSRDDVLERLREAIESHASIETSPSTSDRRLTGQATTERITLAVRDQRLVTRRKSWNIAFDGSVEAGGSGSEVRGEIDVPDRRNLHVMMLLLRLAALLPIAWAIAIAVRNQDGIGASAGTLAFAAVVTLSTLIGSVVLEREGLRSAAADAGALTRFLEGLLTLERA
jgi:hypothetical protein